MESIASLGIKVQSDGIVTANKRLDELSQKSGTAEKATMGLSTAFKALAGVMATLKVVQYAKDAAMMAARYETLGVVMKVVGNNAGYTGAQMGQFETALRKTGIAAIEARTVLTRMAQANIDLASSSKLARIAQDAAVIGNINSSEALERMTHGIQSGQIEILRTIGINVNFENSYQKLAAQLGKTTTELTEAEKMTARVNVVMGAGSQIAGVYEASMGTAGKQMLSMKRYLDDLQVGFGSVFNDLLIVAIAGATGALKQANGEIDKMAANKTLEAWGKGLVYTFAAIADAIAFPLKVLAQLTEAIVATGFRVVKFFEMIENATSGNFKDAKKNWKELGDIGAQYAKSTADRWATSYIDSANKMYDARERNAAGDAAAAKALEEKRIKAGEAGRVQTAAEEAAAVASKKSAKAAKQLAEQWAKVKLSFERKIELSPLVGLDKLLKEIDHTFADYQDQFGKSPELDAWKEREKAIAAEGVAMESLGKQWDVYFENQEQKANIKADFDALVTDMLPAEQRAVALVAKEYEKKREVIELAIASGQASAEAGKAQMEILGKAEIGAQNKAVDAVRDKTDKIQDIWKHAYENMQSITADWLYDMKISWTSLGDLFRKMVAQMVSAWAWGQAKMAFAMPGGAASGGASVAGGAASAATGGGGLGLMGSLSAGYSFLSGGAMSGLQTSVASMVGNMGTGELGMSILNMSSNAFGVATMGIGAALMGVLQGQDFKTIAKNTAFTTGGALLGSIIPGVGTLIGGVVGGLVGSLFGGDKGNSFTLSELVPQTSFGFDTQKGLSPTGFTLPRTNETAKWYGPVADAYSAAVGELQGQFNKQLFAIVDTIPKEMADQMLKSLAATDFAGIQSAASGGRWDIQNAESALKGVAEKYAKGLSGALGSAFGNAFTSYLETHGTADILGNDQVWSKLTSAAQQGIKALYEQAAAAFTGGDMESGAGIINQVSQAMSELANAMAPITEIIETANLTDYEIELRNINKQFDGYAAQLVAAGVDLTKYTDLETARGIVLAKAAENAGSLTSAIDEMGLSIASLYDQIRVASGNYTQEIINRQEQMAARQKQLDAAMEIGGKVGEKTVLLLNALYDYEDDTRIADKRKPVQDILDEANLSDYERETKRISVWLKEQVAIISDIYLEGNPIWMEMDRDLQAALLILSEKAFAVKTAADAAEATAKANTHLAVENKIAILRGETTQQIIDRHTEWTAAMESGDFVMAGLLTTLYGLEDAALSASTALDTANTALQTLTSDVAAAEGDLRAAYEAEAASLKTLTDAVVSAENDLRTAYESEAAIFKGTIDQFTKFGDSLRKFKQSLLLSDLSTLSPEAKYAEAKNQFEDISLRAKLGDADAIEQFQGSSQSFLDASRGYYASTAQYAADFAKVSAALDTTAAVSDRTATNAQKELDTLTKQVSALISLDKSVLSVQGAIGALQTAVSAQAIAQTEFNLLTTQVSALITINQSVLSVKDAIAALQFAKSAEAVGKASVAAIPKNDPITSLYQTLLGRDPEAAGLAYWQNDLAKGHSIADIAASIAQSPEYANIKAIRGYSVGTSYVPEDMTAKIHQGEIIIDPQSSGILRRYGIKTDSTSDEETKALLKEILVELRADKKQRGAVGTETLKKQDDMVDRLEKLTRAVKAA